MFKGIDKEKKTPSTTKHNSTNSVVANDKTYTHFKDKFLQKTVNMNPIEFIKGDEDLCSLDGLTPPSTIGKNIERIAFIQPVKKSENVENSKTNSKERSKTKPLFSPRILLQNLSKQQNNKLKGLRNQLLKEPVNKHKSFSNRPEASMKRKVVSRNSGLRVHETTQGGSKIFKSIQRIVPSKNSKFSFYPSVIKPELIEQGNSEIGLAINIAKAKDCLRNSHKIEERATYTLSDISYATTTNTITSSGINMN